MASAFPFQVCVAAVSIGFFDDDERERDDMEWSGAMRRIQFSFYVLFTGVLKYGTSIVFVAVTNIGIVILPVLRGDSCTSSD